MRVKEVKVAKTQFDEIRKGEDELPLLYKKEQCMSYKVGDILKIYSMNKELKKDRYYFHAQVEKMEKKEIDEYEAFILKVRLRLDMPAYLKGCEEDGV